MKVRVLRFGAAKQLGSSILAHIGEGSHLLGLDLQVVPRSVYVGQGQLVHDVIKQMAPNWVINVAAMTNVDGAHESPELAIKVNGLGPAHISRSSSEVGARTVHISSEAVFDREAQSRYEEDDDCNPVSVYGTSKLAGEALTRTYT